MKTEALVVLYLKPETGAQNWCIYFGGVIEADQEKMFMERDGFIERGRIWVEEVVEYKRVKNAVIK